ncbi:hypothetical protein PspCFBP13508_14575 [Pseudomonas sp. CFBP13508]|nr:hypothetical protein PspCFBP13508_14575 [Pseudomonas sp. CFBP13508]
MSNGYFSHLMVATIRNSKLRVINNLVPHQPSTVLEAIFDRFIPSVQTDVSNVDVQKGKFNQCGSQRIGCIIGRFKKPSIDAIEINGLEGQIHSIDHAFLSDDTHLTDSFIRTFGIRQMYRARANFQLVFFQLYFDAAQCSRIELPVRFTLPSRLILKDRCLDVNCCPCQEMNQIMTTTLALQTNYGFFGWGWMEIDAGCHDIQL